VTLTFDLLTSKFDLFIISLLCRPLVPISAQLVHSFSKHRVHKIGHKNYGRSLLSRWGSRTLRPVNVLGLI